MVLTDILNPDRRKKSINSKSTNSSYDGEENQDASCNKPHIHEKSKSNIPKNENFNLSNCYPTKIKENKGFLENTIFSDDSFDEISKQIDSQNNRKTNFMESYLCYEAPDIFISNNTKFIYNFCNFINDF